MKRMVKLSLLTGVFAAVFVFFGMPGKKVTAFSGGPEPSLTGAPGEGTCSWCHSGGPPGGTLQITGLPANYTPDQEYTLTVTIAQQGRPRFGFQTTVIDDAGRQAGTLIVSDAARTQSVTENVGGNQRTYIEHTSAGINPTSAGQNVWTFRWRAPTASTGQITFYVAGNAANGDFTSFGDSIYTTSSSSAPSGQPTPTPTPTGTSISAFIEESYTRTDGQLARRGLANITVRARLSNGAIVTQLTDTNGTFIFDNAVAGQALLDIVPPTLERPSLRLALNVLANQNNQYPAPIELTRIQGNSIPVNAGQQGGAMTTINPGGNLTTNFGIPSGTQVAQPPNGLTNTLTISLFQTTRTPLNLPVGYYSSTIAQITPFGAGFLPGATLSLPNPDGIPNGTSIRLFRLDQPTLQTPDPPTMGSFIDVGSAIKVSDNRINADEAGLSVAQRISQSSYYFVSPLYPTMTVSGRVTGSDGLPINRAIVSVRGQSVFTSSEGFFTLTSIPVIKNNDSVVLDISHLHPDRIVYRGTSTPIAITASTTVTLGNNLILNLNKEADVSPRGAPNGQVSLSDWVQIGRFAAGIDTPSPGAEFQKADCAPLDTFGNGSVGLADWVQAGRFAALLDIPAQAQGPTSPTPGFNFESGRHIFEFNNLSRLPERVPDTARRVLLSPISTRDDEMQYIVRLFGRGDENAVAFTLQFDPDELEFSGSAPHSRAAFHINRNESGRIAVAVALPPGEAFDVEDGIVVLRFWRKSRNLPSIQFADGTVKGEVVTVNAESVPAVFGTEAREIKRR